MHTKLHLKDDIQNNVEIVIDALCHYYKTSESPLQNLSLVRNTFLDKVQVSIFDIFSEHMLHAESMSPYAADLFVASLRQNFLDTKYSIFRESLLKGLFSNKTKYEKLLYEAISLSGLKGKILIKKSIAENSYIELNESYIFDKLTSSYEIIEKEFVDPKILCIDGYIESVSEVHHLLEQLVKTKTKVIAFVRGLSEDVNHTLKINYDRNTLYFIPIVVPFDLEGINTLNDIAVIAGNDIISSNKGQLISTIDISEYNSVDAVQIFRDRISISNKDSHRRVDSHIRYLQKKSLTTNDAVKELIAKRIQKLGTTQVTVSLPDNKRYSIDAFAIDRCIRSVKAASDYGVIKINDELYPASSFNTAIMLKEKLFSVLKDIGCIIE